MFRDVPALFMTDGVPADLVRAGEPRLRGARPDRAVVAAATAPARGRRPLLRRLAHPLAT